MIITVVCDVLGEENNGTTVAAMNLIRSLKAKGHTVRILCADREKMGQENVFVVPNRNLGKILNAYVKKVGVTLAKPKADVVEKAVENADIVHCMLPFPLSVAALAEAKKRNIPVTAGFHMQAEIFTSYIGLNKLRFLNKMVYEYIYTDFYQYVDGIHYPTEFIRNIFEGTVHAATNGYVISNGVHAYVQKRQTEKPEKFKDKFVILSTGRYSREKSQDVLIRAIGYSDHKDSIQLILAGQGTREKFYKRLAKKLPNPTVFKFLSREEIVDALNFSDMYVHPAETELEGIACLEAIACGKLVVVSSSKLSATKGFAVDKKCVFENRNPKDLARIIDYWIDHPYEKASCEKAYLAGAGVFRQDACMDLMEKMLIKEASVKKQKQKNVS